MDIGLLRFTCASAAIWLTVAATPVHACAVVVPETWGAREMRQAAKRAVDNATLIVDGEVIRPFIPGRQTALVRVARVFKGQQRVEVEVGEGDSCSIILDRLGQKSRMILIGGPSIYLLQEDQSNARYEDQLLGSDRRKVWPFVEDLEPAK
ncbi:hypothetical protein [Sphingomonas sp. IC4-52]|uniref:hypothetical protein n=1 Tax=Sphingomonas sp. IC4-52 TaxID=2887202 RepID=UPI001D107E90|nr:hypothetical protein [Sphingomonas sp. IC4-52]MCC2979386.1 hypothetical protein [Sphingomonas sp. IC4-52]